MAAPSEAGATCRTLREAQRAHTPGLSGGPRLVDPGRISVPQNGRLADWAMATDSFAAFQLAADAFVSLLGHDQLQTRWNDPSALTGYSVGELVAHVASATARAESFLVTEPPVGVEPVSLGGYYGTLKITTAEDADSFVHAYIKSIAEAEAARPPLEVVAQLETTISSISTLLATAEPTAILDLRPLPQTAMAAEDYMATRVVELLVHGMDLAASFDMSMTLPPAAVDVVVEILVATARSQHGDLAVLTALTRSERLGSLVFPVL